MTPGPLTVHFTVNKALTPKRRSRVVENDEYAAFLRRVLRAYARRVARGDIDTITGMAAITAELDDAPQWLLRPDRLGRRTRLPADGRARHERAGLWVVTDFRQARR